MLTQDKLHEYQKKMVNHQCSHPSSMIWADVGLGKTAVTLTSLVHLLNTKFLKAVIVVAPVRVIKLVWKQEAAKWEHTKHLKFSMITGTKDQRTRALLRPADVYLINYENLGWLAETLQTYFLKKNLPLPIDGLVWDEVSKCFAAGTPISTENSAIPIENLMIGDIVMTHLGPRKVTDVMIHQSESMVAVKLSTGQIIHCTPNHPFLLDGRWVGAGTLKTGDMLYGTQNSEIRSGAVCHLRHDTLETQRGSDDMLQNVREYAQNARPLGKGTHYLGRDKGATETQGRTWGVEQGCTVVGRNERKDESVSQEGQPPTSHGGERHGGIVVGEFNPHGSTGEIHSGIHIQDALPATGLSNSLQNRLCRSLGKNCNRNTGTVSHHNIGKTKGLEKTRVLGKVRVEDVIHYERPGGINVWNITVEEAETYFAGGVLVHNCKNSTTQRVKSVKKILEHFKWITGLTGTPASNGYKDLHGQYLVVDKGQRLGVFKTQFKTRFYKKVGPFKEVALEGAEEQIKHLVGDITLEMSAADYNPLPDLIVNNVEIELPPSMRAMYNKMEKEFFLTLDSGTAVEMFNAASLTNRCLQFSNGAMYPIAGAPAWEPIHDLKLDALEDIIDELQGNPVLCSYAYRSDAERIMARFKKLNPINLTECKSEKSLNDAMNRWKKGDCALMIGHAASMSHGIDGLQQRGHHLVWFGLNWSLELYEQFNGRLRRQGQGVPVTCHRIMCRDTLDQAQALALDEKAQNQAGLRNAIKSYRSQRENDHGL